MKIKMIHTISAAYDHNHTRLYEQGEVYEVDFIDKDQDVALMPQWLAEALLIGGYHETEPREHTTNGGITHVVTQEVPAAEKAK